LEEAIQQVRTGNIPLWKCEHRIRARDGSIRWVFEAAVDLRGNDNVVYGSVGLYQDITERKRSEEALKYERDLLQIFLDNIPDTVYFKDRESRFVRINSAQVRMLGVSSAQDAMGKTDLDFMPSELAKTFMEEERKIVETGQPLINRIEFNPTHDGQLRWLSATKVPIKDAAGNVTGIIGISRNITEQKLAQEYEQNRRAILEKVLRLGQEVTEVQNFITTLKKIWHGVRNELDFDRIGIYLYNPDTNNMDGTFGTNNQGEMVDEWDIHIGLDENNPEVEAFNGVLRETDGLYFTPNYESEHDVQNIPIMQGVRDFAAVAARLGDRPVAVICVDQVISGRAITSEQLEALRLFAGYAGLAIENSRLNEALQIELQQQKQAEEQEARRRSMLEKVLELGKQVTETTDLNTTLQRIWHGVHDELGFDRLGVFLYNESRNSMDSMVGTDTFGNMEDTTGIWFPISEWSNFRNVLEKPDGFFLTHHYDEENNIPEGHEMYGVKDYAAVAAWAGNKPVAVICVDQVVSKRRIASEQLEALRLFAGYAALALENTRLYNALQDELVQQKQAEERETRRRFILEKVVELGKQITETTDFVTTLQRIWHSVHDDLNFDRLGIFLYDHALNSVNGTFGTNRQGEMVEEWDLRIPLDVETGETAPLINVIREENGVYVTDNYTADRDIPSGHSMEGVKAYAAVAAWAGDKPIGIVCVDNLITERPITEEQLEALRLFAGYAGLAIQNARLNATLEEDIAHRQSLIDELEAKNAELERFTYTVSHDLKSPLVTITGFLGYVEKDAIAGDTARLKTNIERILRAAQKMQNLLNDLLELSRIGRLMNAPENVPFHAIVREALEHVRGRLEANRVRVEVQDTLPSIRGDKIRLIEVVQNLVDNAAKFTKGRPNPLIKIGTNGTHKNGFLIFFVSDNGIGIASQYHEKIFGLFDKLDPTVEGTGVGLTLVKRIIEVHGGTIWLESQPGVGTTFYFTLPGISFEE
jgi:PAS domain S-box-containing protein